MHGFSDINLDWDPCPPRAGKLRLSLQPSATVRKRREAWKVQRTVVAF